MRFCIVRCVGMSGRKGGLEMGIEEAIAVGGTGPPTTLGCILVIVIIGLVIAVGLLAKSKSSISGEL